MKEQKKTGGGIAEGEPISEIDNRIVGLIGEVCVAGVKGGFESDFDVFPQLMKTLGNY